MATKEEIEAAYSLVYEAEKALAIELINGVIDLGAIIDKIATELPNQAGSSNLAQQLNLVRSNISMLNHNIEALKNTYGLHPTSTMPGMPT